MTLFAGQKVPPLQSYDWEKGSRFVKWERRLARLLHAATQAGTNGGSAAEPPSKLKRPSHGVGLDTVTFEVRRIR